MLKEYRKVSKDRVEELFISLLQNTQKFHTNFWNYEKYSQSLLVQHSYPIPKGSTVKPAP